MKGSEAIPSLHLTTLNTLISMFPQQESMYFSSLFPATKYPSDQIEWEIEFSSGGMTPFVAPGSQAPTVGLDGYGNAKAGAAYYKEKMYLDEDLLNNLRRPGTDREYMQAERHISKGLFKINSRCARRREWMVSKMLTNNGFTYQVKGGLKFTVNYGIPTQNTMTLVGNDVWGTGTTRDAVRDIFDAKRTLSDYYGMVPDTFVMNSTVLKLLLMDSSIRDLLKKSAFGDGDLFARPAQVIGHLIGIGGVVVYDDMYEIPALLTGNLTAGVTTTVPVDDATDFEVGGKLRIFNINTPTTFEERTISSVDKIANTCVIASAFTAAYTAGAAKLAMIAKYVPDNKVFMMTKNVDGRPVAEVMEAPFGLRRTWGRYVDKKETWDPEGVWLRVQDKALPVLYYPQSVFIMQVK